MKKSDKILVIIGTLLLGLNIWSMFKTNSNIEAIQSNISKSQQYIDTALTNLKFSRSQLDSIDNKMVQFTSYVTGVQKAVDTININKNTSEHKSELILKELRKKADKAKEELTRLESPPPAIKIKSL